MLAACGRVFEFTFANILASAWRIIMGKIWEFFENMNEYVYVSDADTYELVYMNKKARKIYGINSSKDIESKKCYEVLQNCLNPCAICNNESIEQGFFKEWEYYHPIIGENLMIKDTIVEEEGRRYKVEIAINADVRVSQSKILKKYQNLEAFVNEGLRVALRADTPDHSVEIVLEYLGKALNGERIYIFEKNKKGGDDNTYEWVANGVTPEKDNLQDVPPEVCASWYQQFSENKSIIIEDLEEIREVNPIQYEVLQRQNIHSLAVVPLYDDRKIIGFYGIDNPPAESLDYAANMLQIMGHFMVSSLKRRNLVRELQDMSYRDYLTKVGNRHAMNDYINNLKESESIGILYGDITGLKRVNDTEGHEAGDRLIVRACDSLNEVFGDYGVFRIGGDELLALCPKIDENVFNERIKKLKSILPEKAVVMTVGFIWNKDISVCMDKLLAEAERLMYEDKNEYYRISGIDRRKT